MTDYEYVCKPNKEIIENLLKSELDKIYKLPQEIGDPETGIIINKRQEAIDTLYEINSSNITNAIKAEHLRVLNNLKNIPLNTRVRISYDTLIQRVHNGWIYFTELYNNNMEPTVIATISTFVSEN